MLKKALFRSMVTGAPGSSSRARHGFRRTMAIKAPSSRFYRPGTPYPKINNIPLIAGVGGTLQLAPMGNRISSHPIPDAASSNSFSTSTPAYYNDVIATENIRLRHELEELRSREASDAGPSITSIPNSPTTNGTFISKRERLILYYIHLFVILILEVGLNFMGLTVSESPIASPIPRRALQAVDDDTMLTN